MLRVGVASDSVSEKVMIKPPVLVSGSSGRPEMQNR
jgi:hypothetical protein